MVACTIVGGGLSGIFLALKLSHQGVGPLVLIEESRQLGGRLFFAGPEGSDYFGLGWEAFSPNSGEILERHLMSQLTPEERALIENHLQNTQTLARDTYIVKKEFTSLKGIISGSSEYFTRNTAEILNKWVSLATQQESDVSLNDDQKLSSEMKQLFTASAYWKDLSKNPKEELTPFLETVMKNTFAESSVGAVWNSLAQLFSNKTVITDVLLRKAFAENILLEILKKRGVHVRLNTSLNRLQQVEETKKTHWRLDCAVGDSGTEDFFSDQVVLALPLHRSLHFMQREYMSGQQSRFIHKIKPISLCALEIPHFSKLHKSDWPSRVQRPTQLIFPMERVWACWNSTDSLIAWSYLGFEESLQAQTVKDAVNRCRRACTRIVAPEKMSHIINRSGLPARDVPRERISLLGTAISVSSQNVYENDLKNVKSSHKGLYFCGDSFAYGTEPWQSIMETVTQVAQAIST